MVYVLSALLVSVALYTDIRTYKIKNSANLVFAVAGLLYGRTLQHLWGCLFPLLLVPFFVVRMLGAGDIKLFCALGAIVGMPDIMWITAGAVLLNGVIAVVLLLVRKNGRERFGRLICYIRNCISLRCVLPYSPYVDRDNGIFRYTVGIAASVYLYCAMRVLGIAVTGESL